MPFLPLTVEEMHEYGWSEPDFVYVIGDAYIDHPSFGPAIISRVLENFGYKVCIISQPNINDNSEFKRFGTPRLGFLVCAGNIDSMGDHYSVSKRRRKKERSKMNKKQQKYQRTRTRSLQRLFQCVDG